MSLTGVPGCPILARFVRKGGIQTVANKFMVSDPGPSLNHTTPRVKSRGRKLLFVLLILLSPGIIVLTLVALALWFGIALPYNLCLYTSIHLLWLRRGKDVLFVYSNSPHWKEYIEANILPKMAHRSVVLNWSDRSSWDRWALSVMCFRHFAGSREFNPMAIVFRPFRGAKVFRFWRAFRDYKHGEASTLQEAEKSLFDYLA